mmetsp:Transcript_46771/g.109216  ORF Transcript_46771/g.109216 Transcript_46771/m.109216 type:complete len:97 (-) Transcript_46771:166-456(-)
MKRGYLCEAEANATSEDPHADPHVIGSDPELSGYPGTQSMPTFLFHSVCLHSHGVGVKPAATQAAMQTPSAELQAMIAAGVPTPAVTVPKVAPAAA